MASDWSTMLQALKDAGYDWEITGRGKHIKVTKGGGRLATIPNSPSDHRSLQNALGTLRREAGFVWRPKQTRTRRNTEETE